MTRRIDLNADLGEGVTDDAALLEVVTSASIRCGFHAGDSVTMRIVCRMAVERRVAIRAQVSYDDREGFGRRDVDVPPRVLRSTSRSRSACCTDAVRESAESAPRRSRGALYNRVVHDLEQAEAVLLGSSALPVPGRLCPARCCWRWQRARS